MPITIDGSKGIILPSWTAATRPASAANSQMGFNTTTGSFEWYSSQAAAWTPVGGAITGAPSYSIGYTVVAGGGAGRGSLYVSEGGGGGGVLTGIVSVSSNTAYTITVGAGGTCISSTTDNGTPGANSSIIGTGVSITSVGGGAYNRFGGGAGGGYGNGIYPGSAYISGPRQGYDGGFVAGGSPGYGNPGGGGAGGPGFPGSSSAPGAGGTGLLTSVSGVPTYYGGGGAGGCTSSGTTAAGVGGAGGGGTGGRTAGGGNGTVNTGGGGGGNGGGGQNAGGQGGSGIVIISYNSPTQIATGGTVTNYINYVGGSVTSTWVHTFTATGTFTA